MPHVVLCSAEGLGFGTPLPAPYSAVVDLPPRCVGWLQIPQQPRYLTVRQDSTPDNIFPTRLNSLPLCPSNATVGGGSSGGGGGVPAAAIAGGVAGAVAVVLGRRAVQALVLEGGWPVLESYSFSVVSSLWAVCCISSSI